MNETATTEALLDALRAAGVDLDAIEVPDESYDLAGAEYTRSTPFMARRDDGAVLYFNLSESWEGEEPEGWLWAIWEGGKGCASMGWEPDLDSMGWEPDLASMVDRVARFLSTEAKR